jgi:hypothetical protein
MHVLRMMALRLNGALMLLISFRVKVSMLKTPKRCENLEICAPSPISSKAPKSLRVLNRRN